MDGKSYLEPTWEAGRALLQRNVAGPIVMLNLLRFRAVADYAAAPALAPDSPITGREAFQRYIEHSLPFVRAAGGEVPFMGSGGDYLIGPEGAGWDLVILVRHRSVADFMSFASNEAYLAGIGHRIAALADSRLLPLVEETG